MGVIAPWYLKKPQFDAYRLMNLRRFPFCEQSRRTGKTTTTLVHVQEKLRQNDGWIWRWCEPWKYQAREIVMPEMDRLQSSCPEKLKFKFYRTDSFYEGPNGSRLYLRGVNDDRGESARGPYAHGITADEYGSWKDPDYIVNEVLLPQVLSTDGQVIKTSTPPRDLGHKYYDERERAAREGRFIQKIIWDFVGYLYTQQQIDDICSAVGGENSPSWQREFLCRPVSDPDSLVIPEFTDENIVEDDYARPQFPVFYVGGDSGADDNTAILFGWYDFKQNEVVIEEEFITKGETTSNIVSYAKAIEAQIWGEVKPKKRVYDADKQLIYDIIADHKWSVMLPRKEDRLSAIHELRVEVQSKRFKVKRRCKNLIRQLKVGMWKDDRHLEFERSEGLGHLDAIAAAIYFNRSIDRQSNPVPHNFGLSRESHFITSARVIPPSSSEGALLSVFGSKTRGLK
jgi:hypothetical protein